MKTFITIVTALSLTGCATGCYEACIFGFGPGNPVFNAMADSADRNDPCQTKEFSELTGQRLKTAHHQRPDFCFANNGKTKFDLYDRKGQYQGTIRSR